MPVDPFTAGAAFISAVRGLTRRGARPIVRAVNIAADGTATVVWGSNLAARVLSRLPVNSELTRLAQTGQAVSAQVAAIFPGAVQEVNEWRAAFGGPQTETDFTDTAGVEGGVLGLDFISPPGPEDFFVPRFVRNMHRSIPGGAAGMAQQTPATLTTIGPSITPRFTGRVARRSNRAARQVPHARHRKAAKRLVKGSHAAKAHMAKLRKLAMKARKRRAK